MIGNMSAKADQNPAPRLASEILNLTKEQAEDLCKAVGKDIREMEEYEICELVDRAIDDFISKGQ